MEDKNKKKCCLKNANITVNQIVPIDYDKLAEAIVKAQEISKELPKTDEKIGFWKAVWLIIVNREKKTGLRTAYVLASVIGYIFNAIAIFGVFLFFTFLYAIVCVVNWKVSVITILLQIVMSIVLLFTTAVLSLIFRGMANEINIEKDRNYVMNFFFGLASIVSLIIALISLF